MSHQKTTVEAGLETLCGSAKTEIESRLEVCKQRVREEPFKALAIAFGAGLLANRLPVRSIFVTHVKIISGLFLPGLIAYGAAKTCEKLQGKCKSEFH